MRRFVVMLVLIFWVKAVNFAMASDLDRWQLHEMAATALEKDPNFFSSSRSSTSTVGPNVEKKVTTKAPVPPPIKAVEIAEAENPSSHVKSVFHRKKEPTLECLREEAHNLARKGLVYQFGSDDPEDGGLDCSGAVQHLLSSIGVRGVPRTSYLQYEWLKKSGTLHEVRGKNSSRKLLKKLHPGDLIFWGGTWKSGHKVSHVMIYMGYNPDNGLHYVFGARGKRTEGLLGAGVDVFVLNPDRGKLVGHGRIPGLRT